MPGAIPEFEEWSAAVHAGCDLEKWENGTYDTKFKEKVVAFYRVTRLIKIHSEIAESEYSKKQMNKRGRK